MGIQKELTIDLVLLFGSKESADALGESLTAALREVTAYMAPEEDWLAVPMPTRSRSHAMVRPRYRCWYVAEEPLSFDADEEPSELTFARLTRSESVELWGAALQRRSRFDAPALGAAASAHLESTQGVGVEFAVTLTDGELIPPSDWRYILWQGYPGGAVVSWAAMDPRYWGASMSLDALPRRQQVKHGVRAATMSVVGSKLGLSRCENPSCFMFAAVDSVSRLPEMRSIGPEHEVLGLTRAVFPVDEPVPERVSVPREEVAS